MLTPGAARSRTRAWSGASLVGRPGKAKNATGYAAPARTIVSMLASVACRHLAEIGQAPERRRRPFAPDASREGLYENKRTGLCANALSSGASARRKKATAKQEQGAWPKQTRSFFQMVVSNVLRALLAALAP